MPKIQIPTPLRQYAGKQSAVEVKAGTISDAQINTNTITPAGSVTMTD